MNVHLALVDATRACIRGRQVDWQHDALTAPEWEELIALAREQKVVPMVVQSCYAAPAFLAQEPAFRAMLLGRSRQMVASGARRSAALAVLWNQLERAGFHCVIMKGAACCAVYPASGTRISSDEDILVPDEEFRDCVAFLQAQGFTFTKENCDLDSFEVGMERRDGMYLELHRCPFAPDDPVLGGCNRWFDGYAQRAIEVAADGVPLRVLGPQDHMLLLIVHAFKHLLGSGLGLRQVCDIILWAESYGAQIDWQDIGEKCRTVRAAGFAAAVFRLGQMYLEFDAQKACVSEAWMSDETAAELLLNDLMSGGIYGKATLSHTHSSTITLNAVAADRRGGRTSLLRTVFPPRAQMEKSYPYLKRTALLLPVAWGSRLLHYGTEVVGRKDSDVSEAIRIGQDRTEFLRKLDVLD